MVESGLIIEENKMKRYTQEDFDGIVRADDGYKYLPTGDYSDVGFNNANRLVFDVGCIISDHAELGNDCRFGMWCQMGGYCRVGVGCHFERHCSISAHCVVGWHTAFDDYCECGESCTFDEGCTFGESCKFGEGCTIKGEGRVGDYSRFGAHCVIGTIRNSEYALDKGCTIGSECKFGTGCTIGVNSTVGSGCKFANNCKIGIGEGNGIYLKEGCEIGPSCILKSAYCLRGTDIGDGCELISCNVQGGRIGNKCKLSGLFDYGDVVTFGDDCRVFRDDITINNAAFGKVAYIDGYTHLVMCDRTNGNVFIDDARGLTTLEAFCAKYANAANADDYMAAVAYARTKFARYSR